MMSYGFLSVQKWQMTCNSPLGAVNRSWIQLFQPGGPGAVVAATFLASCQTASRGPKMTANVL